MLYILLTIERSSAALRAFSIFNINEGKNVRFTKSSRMVKVQMCLRNFMWLNTNVIIEKHLHANFKTINALWINQNDGS